MNDNFPPVQGSATIRLDIKSTAIAGRSLCDIDFEEQDQSVEFWGVCLVPPITREGPLEFVDLLANRWTCVRFTTSAEQKGASILREALGDIRWGLYPHRSPNGEYEPPGPTVADVLVTISVSGKEIAMLAAAAASPAWHWRSKRFLLTVAPDRFKDSEGVGLVTHVHYRFGSEWMS